MKIRNLNDRRSGVDRRRACDADYFQKGGRERRVATERRVSPELRSGWVRDTDWSSIIDLDHCDKKSS